MLKMSIGENLIKIRKEFGFTREEFANIVGLRPGTLSGYESGERIPKLDFIINVSDMLGLTIDEVVGHYVEDPKI